MPGQQTTVGPSHEEVLASQPHSFEEWWQGSGLNRLFVKPAVDLLDYIGQVASGQVNPMGPEGHVTPEAFNAITPAAGMVPIGGSLSRPVEGLLAANAHFTQGEKFALVQSHFPGDSLSQQTLLEGGKVQGWDGGPMTLEDLQQMGPKIEDPFITQLKQEMNNLLDPNYKYVESPASPVSMEQQPFVDPLAPKPLDSEKYPWLAKPETPDYENAQGSGILDRFDPAFGAVRNELYRRGMSQDQLNEIQQAFHSGTEEGLARADQLSQELRSLLPPDWNYAEGNRYSTVVPHAVDRSNLPPVDMPDHGWMNTNEHERLDLVNKRLEDRVNSLISKADPEALSRAQEQGYNTDLPLYRGSATPTDQFMDPSFKKDERGMFFADKPGITGAYGRYTYPVYTRAKDPYEVDFSGIDYGGKGVGPWSSGDVHHHIEQARAAGHDMAILRNLRDDDPSALSKRSTQDQYVIFDPSLIRSPLAKFDPKRMEENNLLASQGIGINPFPWLEDKKKKGSAF